MAETYQIVTKVWIAPGCIVCDSCENDCPEVFDVQEETCIIRPPAMKADFLSPLTPSIQVAAEGCPVDVIKFELKEVEGKAPWADLPAPVAGEVGAKAPAAKAASPVALGPPDPRMQALLSTSKISPSLSAGFSSSIRRSPEINQAEEIVRAVKLPKDAPPDQRLAMLAVAGAYQPAVPMGQRLRDIASKAGIAAKTSRRQFNFALAIGWAALAFVGATFGAMFQDFFGPKVLKEPKKQIRVGRLADYANPGVYEQFKPIGIWVVNLQPSEEKLMALSTTCTHLGCIPNWLSAELKFKCPCHGSGYYITGVNFEGPTPRPLERFAVSKDADGYIVIDMSKVYRSELGEWENPESFISLS
ncbi:MAG TPA: Rieske 2Fe-2S domain-containing protein [Tepidisphaeraceae bacterium]|jgi:cytochrome b6-f complex iron-sulfur subunit|nr:Rieske 2Fe-2S domain-containing protein [Tepidisphaeraceae bacterium]